MPTRKLRKAIQPGTTADALTLAQKDATDMLRTVVRRVADLPAGASPTVVWSRGADEVLVDTGTIALACTTGLVRVSLTVDCDQLDRPATAMVPLAVGSPGRPSGLVMSTFTRVDAPPVVAETWSDALAAFAWESLLELARQLCADVGRDTKGRALLPADISAAPAELIVTPIARHDITLRGLRAVR